MNFKGSVLITDPSYILAKSKNDWESFSRDNKMPSEFFTTYVIGSVCNGVWHVNRWTQPFISLNFANRWTEWLNDLELDEIIKLLLEGRMSSLGKFKIESGYFGIFYKDEVMRYNPEFFLSRYQECFAIVENFDGNIDYINKNNEFYIYGTGNKTIFTY